MKQGAVSISNPYSWCFAFTVWLLLFFKIPIQATNYTVSSLDHPGTGIGTSGSLNWCIIQANASAGPHTIQFGVSGTISITSSLPALSQSITIDGSTAPGYLTDPVIVIQGNNASVYGIRISAVNCKIYSITVDQCGYAGISVTSDAADYFEIGAAGKGCMVTGGGQYGISITGGDYGIVTETRVGTDWNATSCLGNDYDGIMIQSGASYNQVYECWISCNGYSGIRISGSGSNYNQIRACTIGPINSTCAYNGYYGVTCESGASYNEIGGNAASDRNKIAGNQYDGITITGTATLYNKIFPNNFICNAPPGGYEGVRLTSSGNGNKAPPVITAANSTSVTGTSGANDLIDVYRALSPTAAGCSGYSTKQGADYLGSTSATAGGAWSIGGIFSGSITAIATSVAGNSSPFAAVVNTGVSAANEIACSGVLLLLPVEMTSFQATCENGKVKLRWFTSSELNNEGFIIQRSGDGNHFEDIGYVTGTGTSLLQHGYEYLDATASGFQYYRLLQIDLDGSVTYSSQVAAGCEPVNSSLLVSPNPAHEFIQVGRVASGCRLRLLDAAGKVLKEVYTESEGEAAFYRLDVLGIPRGWYLLEVKGNTGPVLKVVVIQ